MTAWLTSEWVIGTYQRVLLVWVGFATGWICCWLAPRFAEWWLSRKPIALQRRIRREEPAAGDGAAVAEQRPSSEPPPLPRGQHSASAVWECKVGRFGVNESLPDSDMRDAVWEAFYRLTGKPPHFCFSGWGTDQLMTRDELRLALEHAQQRDPELLQ